MAVFGPERETVLVDREWELLERAGSPWGFSPSLFRCSWQHLCLCFPPGKRVVGLFCPERRKPIGHCAWLVASDLRGFLLASGLGPCPLGMKASQWATASPIKVGEDMYAHVLQKYLCCEPCANVVSAHSRLWGQCRAVPALQIETGWNGHFGHQDFSPKLEKTRHSLAVQGSGFCASLSGAVSIPAQGTKIPWAKWCGQKKKKTNKQTTRKGRLSTLSPPRSENVEDGTWEGAVRPGLVGSVRFV